MASERICEGRLIGLQVDTVHLSEGRVTRRELRVDTGYIAWRAYASGVGDDRWWGDLGCQNRHRSPRFMG